MEMGTKIWKQNKFYFESILVFALESKFKVTAIANLLEHTNRNRLSKSLYVHFIIVLTTQSFGYGSVFQVNFD